MAENPEIPVFKERRMTGTNSTTGLNSSYYISNSYAGILRLSPNNSATLLDANNSVNITDEITDYINFSDSIILPLQEQFISVSTSDGIMLDMRIFAEAVEYNNLYIKGALSIPNAIIYTNKNSKFTLGDVDMPISYNSNLEVSSEESFYVAPEIDDINETYILVNMANDGEPSRFEYKSIKEIIGGFVTDSLNGLSSLPTGSIHWIPVNLEQYEALLNRENNEHNSSNPICNTLIRDFLLCDGSRYKNSDFPELAKILYKENITYWKPSGDYMISEKESNTYEKEKTFRVPDMRSMFIQYVIPSLKKINDKNNKVGDYEIDSSKNQEIIINKALDKHYHYIVLDNTMFENSNTAEWTNINGKQTITLNSAVDGVDNWGLPKWAGNGYGKPLAKYGSLRRDSGNSTRQGKNMNTTKGCDTRNCAHNASGQGFPSYILEPLLGGGGYSYNYNGNSNYCNGAGPTCGYILSGSTRYLNKINANSDDEPESTYFDKGAGLPLNQYVGQSSWNISMDPSITPKEAPKINYTKDAFVYKKEKKYVEYDEDTCKLLKYENTPEFYACLPLIKI